MESRQDSSSESTANRTKKLGWLLAIGLLCFAGAAVWIVLGLDFRTQFFSSPVLSRENDKYGEAMGSPESPPPLDTNLLESLKITSTTNELEIQFTNTISSSTRLLNYQLEEIQRGVSAFQWEEGEIGILYQGIAYGRFQEAQQSSYSVQMPAQFYDLTGREMETKELEELGGYYSRNLNYEGLFPAVQYMFEYPEKAKVKFIGFQFFDARTHEDLASGYSWGARGTGMMSVQTHLKRWHSGPLKLVADVGFGPLEKMDIPVQVGSRVHYKNWALHLVGIQRGESRSSGSSSQGSNRTLTFRFEEDEGEERTTFVFVGSPWAYHLPVDFEFYDAEGNEIPGGGSGSSSYYRMAYAKAPPDKVHTIRALIYSDVRRLVFDLPEVYGLPKENYDVANLFEIHLPHVRVRSQWEFKRFVEDLVQMEFKSRAGNFSAPQGYFPLLLTNTTPKEVLQEFGRVAMTNQLYTLRIHSESNLIEFGPPIWELMKEKLKTLF